LLLLRRTCGENISVGISIIPEKLSQPVGHSKSPMHMAKAQVWIYPPGLRLRCMLRQFSCLTNRAFGSCSSGCALVFKSSDKGSCSFLEQGSCSFLDQDQVLLVSRIDTEIMHACSIAMIDTDYTIYDLVHFHIVFSFSKKNTCIIESF
jgi:hypothetical protein